MVGRSGAYGASLWGEGDGEVLPQTPTPGQPGCLPSMGCSMGHTLHSPAASELSPSTGYRSKRAWVGTGNKPGSVELVMDRYSNYLSKNIPESCTSLAGTWLRGWPTGQPATWTGPSVLSTVTTLAFNPSWNAFHLGELLSLLERNESLHQRCVG